jgi:hypothetical protein
MSLAMTDLRVSNTLAIKVHQSRKSNGCARSSMKSCDLTPTGSIAIELERRSG